MTALAAISLTTPLMLGGLALLALPIAAHLLNRRARRKLIFPSIQLLTASQASQSQLFRLRRWILLALRCAAVILLILAFARPLWRDDQAAVADETDGAAVVIVLDRSASSAQRAGGLSAMQSLRATAGRTLDALMPGVDRVNVVFADAHPAAALPALTRNLQAVRQEIDQADATPERGDMPAAIGLAGQLLAEHNGVRRLVIASDLQATNWRPLLEPSRLPALPAGTQITIVPFEAPTPANIALSNPRLAPHTPIIGRPATLRVTVHNHGDVAAQVPVSLDIAGRAAATQNVQLGPRQSQEIAFTLQLQRESEELVVTVPDDALSADNRLYLLARAAQRVPVIVIGDDPPDQPGGASYFVIRAIAPNGDARDRYAVRHLSSGDVTPASLRDAAAVVLSYTSTLSASAINAIDDYARSGGGLILFCGEGPVRENLLAWEQSADAQVLPWIPDAQRNLALRGDRVYFGEGDYDAPLLREFDPASRQALSQIPLRLSWTVRDVRPEARVLLRFNDGSPALAERAVGAGRLLMANFTPALSGGDIGKFGSFVALMHSGLEVVQPPHARAPMLYAGAAVALTTAQPAMADARGIRVTDPADQPIGVADVTRLGSEIVASVSRTAAPGFYRLWDNERLLAAAAVNVDPQEGDLHRIDPEQLRAALSSAGAQVDVRSAAAAENVIELRGRPLWGWFAAAAMLLLATEMLLTGWWRR